MQKVKRHFQLLEVLIAFFLVVTCAIPIMTSFVGIYREQRKMQTDVERDHLLHLAHAKLIEYLYKEGAKGQSLKELLGKEMMIPALEGWEPLDQQTKYQFSYHLGQEKPKPKETKGTNKFLLNVEVKENTYQHTYKAFVKRVFKEGQDEFENN